MKHLASHYALASLFAAFLLFLLKLRETLRWRARAQGRPLPPGPRRLPIIGNILDVPTWKPWIGFQDLSTRFGAITYLELLGERMVVLSSPATIHDLLVKRAAITADRVKTPLVALVGHDFNFAVMPYGLRWRRHRRMMWQHFHPGQMDKYQPAQRAVTNKFLAMLLTRPTKLHRHLRYQVIGTMMKITYGVELEDEDDERIAISDRAFDGMREVTAPMQFLLQHFPFVQHVPTRFFGAAFHRVLAGAIGACAWMTTVPFDQAKAEMGKDPEQWEARRETEPIAADVLRRIASATETKGAGEGVETDEEVARNVAALIVEGGSDTTLSTLEGLFLALSLYPEVQKKAQAELDAIVGRDRLPDFEDRSALVYIEAMFKEALRWHNVSPLSISHCTTEDDELHGFFIPAGTTIVPNIWACMHDPQIYPKPDRFMPERFIRDGKLDPDVLDPASLVFGSGRRICPGRYFAESALFLTAASVLHVFDIGPPVDERGQPVKIELAASHGFLSYPEDSRCTIRPRSAEAAALVMSSQER